MSDFSSSEESEFSELSETENSDLENLMEERLRPKNEQFFEEIVPRYNESEYMEHFRVSRGVAKDIAQRIENSEYYKWQSGPHEKVTSLKTAHIFLWFAGHQTASFRDVGDRFGICISCLHKIVKTFTYFLSNLSPEVITWPNIEEQMETERFFSQNNGFPGIIGSVDGTHIKIDKPQDDPDSYINRKGYYSIQAQIVYYHKLKIRDLFVGYPGSVHDARIFRTSPLFNSLQEKCLDNHILGDSAYPLMYNLLTPFPDRGMLNRNQLKYNMEHSSSKIYIEHCNGVLKQKWRQLYHLKVRDIRTAVHFTRACCVLHNLGINNTFVDININLELEHDDNIIYGEVEREEGINQEAVHKRNRIVNILQ